VLNDKMTFTDFHTSVTKRQWNI